MGDAVSLHVFRKQKKKKKKKKKIWLVVGVSESLYRYALLKRQMYWIAKYSISASFRPIALHCHFPHKKRNSQPHSPTFCRLPLSTPARLPLFFEFQPPIPYPDKEITFICKMYKF